MGIPDSDKLVPIEEDLKPTDPVTEFMNILNGKPVKAFMYQDHEAHIQAHMAAAQNPKIMEMMQQNPQAQALMAAGAAHITEHIAFLYRRKIEEELGTSLPDPEEPLPEDIECRLSQLVAPAAAQLTGKPQQQKAAEENGAKQQDPIILLEQEKIKQQGEKIANDRYLGKMKIMTEALGEMEKHQTEQRTD